MIYLSKRIEPQFWIDFRRKHPDIQYDQLQETEEGCAIRKKIREYNNSQQFGLCAYCCRRINIDNSLNEHIQPKGVSQYAGKSMDYSNIVSSCSTLDGASTCGIHKQDDYNPKLFVSPLEKDCESYFEYYPNGEVVSDSKEGKYTIDLLNLNSLKLRKAREAQLKVCESYQDPDSVRTYMLEPDENGELEPFVDIIRYFYSENASSSGSSFGDA